MRLLHRVVLAAYFALLLLLILWHAWLFPSRYFPTALVLIVACAPLLLPLRGLLQGKARSHIWACFLMLPYFVHGVGETFANPPQRIPAALQILFSLGVFFAASWYARLGATHDSSAESP